MLLHRIRSWWGKLQMTNSCVTTRAINMHRLDSCGSVKKAVSNPAPPERLVLPWTGCHGTRVALSGIRWSGRQKWVRTWSKRNHATVAQWFYTYAYLTRITGAASVIPRFAAPSARRTRRHSRRNWYSLRIPTLHAYCTRRISLSGAPMRAAVNFWYSLSPNAGNFSSCIG